MTLSTTQLAELVNRFKPLDVAEMPTTVTDQETFKHPVIDPAWREKPLPRGRVHRYQLSIAQANEGKFYYGYLDSEDLEGYGGAFRVVTADCEAAVSEGRKIPDNYFNSHGVIYDRGLLYSYCTWDYHMAHCKRSELRGARTLASFMPGEKASEKDASGKAIASVHNKGLSSRLVTVGEADEAKNAKEKGN